jgi:hypothetical protein
MSIKVEQLPDEPIIVVTLSGDITVEVVQDMFAQCAQLADDMGGRVYRLTDIRLTEITFPELVQVLSKISKGQPGSPSDPRICGVLLGTHGWSRFFVDSLHQEQYGQLNIPIFEEFDAALDYLREQIAAG